MGILVSLVCGKFDPSAVATGVGPLGQTVILFLAFRETSMLIYTLNEGGGYVIFLSSYHLHMIVSSSIVSFLSGCLD